MSIRAKITSPVLLLLAACAPGIECEEALCAIDAPMDRDCFESLVSQTVARVGELPDAYQGFAWRTDNLDSEDGATMRQGGVLWSEVRPGLSKRRNVEVIVHELMHMAEYARTGIFPEGLPLYEMHTRPRGYFRYVYGPESLEQRVLNDIDDSCL